MAHFKLILNCQVSLIFVDIGLVLHLCRLSCKATYSPIKRFRSYKVFGQNVLYLLHLQPSLIFKGMVVALHLCRLLCKTANLSTKCLGTDMYLAHYNLEFLVPSAFTTKSNI